LTRLPARSRTGLLFRGGDVIEQVREEYDHITAQDIQACLAYAGEPVKSGNQDLPVLPIGILLGEWLHGRIQERHFRVFIYALLLASGVKLLV